MGSGADGAHDGVDAVAEAALEEVAVQVAVGFAMADDGLDGGPASFAVKNPPTL